MLALTLLLALDAGAAADSGPSADAGPRLQVEAFSARLEGDGVQPGDLVHLVLTFGHPAALSVVVPEPLPDGKGMARAGAVERSLSAADAGVQETLRIPFVLLDTRGVESPGFSLSVGGVELAVPPLPLIVGDAGPSAGPPEVQFTAMSVERPGFPEWVGRAALGLLLLLVASALVRRWLRRARRTPEPLIETVDCGAEALAALDALRRSLVDDELALRAAWFELMEVLRSYLDRRFGLSATHSTSLELLRAFGQMRVPGFSRSGFEELLAQADAVRYARGAVDLAHVADLIDRVELWVQGAERAAGAEHG
jgi:hypothetical protein